MRATTTVRTLDVRTFGPGEHCEDAKPGDILLVRHSGLISWAIRFGQRLRFRGTRRQYAWCNHAAVIVVGGPNALLVEQAARGGRVVTLSTYVAEEYAVITLAIDTAAPVTDFAASTVGDRYGWPTILAAVIYCVTGLRIDLGFGNWMICSVATSEAMKVGGVLVAPIFDQLPADIAAMCNVSA